MDRNINIVVLYSASDISFWEEMSKHINLLAKSHKNVQIWSTDDLTLGASVSQNIRDHLRRADITLLLLSADFAFEDVFDIEARTLLSAYARQKDSHRYVMPIIVRDFIWRDHYDEAYDIEKLKFFDKIAHDPENREAIYREITETLNDYIEQINAHTIQMVIPTWVGYIGGIMYNNGFVKNQQTPLYQQFKRTLRFELNDDMDATCQAMLAGEADLIWATLDRLPSVLHRLRDHHPKVIFQASWSNGADVIIARNHIKSVEDLKGKKVIYPHDSPAFTFLLYVLKQHGMQPSDLVHIPQRLTDLDLITKSFLVDDSIDAVVIWSPYAEACLAEGREVGILVSSANYPHLIADVVVASEDFVHLNAHEMAEMLSGWLAQMERCSTDGLYKTGAIGVLIEAIIRPLPAIIPSIIRGELTQSLQAYFDSSLDKVHLCTLADNLRFFGLDGQPAEAELLYNQFLALQYPEFINDPDMQWPQVIDTHVLLQIAEAVKIAQEKTDTASS